MPSPPRRLIVVGDSLFAEIAYEYFTYDSDYDVVGFAVEDAYRTQDTFHKLPVHAFDNLEEHVEVGEHSVFAALTYAKLNRVRERLAGEAKLKGFALASYVSSRAFVWRNVEFGEHNFIFEDNTIQPFVKVGDDNVMWSGNHIGHHSTIGSHIFIASHAVISGNVTIGDNSFIGVNATIVNDISIGHDNWIGPAVTVMKSTQENQFWLPPRSALRETTPRQAFGVDEAA
jgi:sugar O-acyltransferase (sialic acid O-acetyltransferase NeuD family)